MPFSGVQDRSTAPPTMFGNPIKPHELDYFEFLVDPNDVNNPEARNNKIRSSEAYKKHVDALHKTTTKGSKIVVRAYQAYNNLDEARQRHMKMWRYADGDIWHNLIKVKDPDTGQPVQMTEEQYIRRSGRVPWRLSRIDNNLRNLVGQLRQNRSSKAVYSKWAAEDGGIDYDAAEMVTQLLRNALEEEMYEELDVETFWRMLVTGLYLQKEYIDYDPKEDVFVPRLELCNFDRMYFNTDIEDGVRLRDLRFVGEFRDWTISDVLQYFAGDDEALRLVLSDHLTGHGGADPAHNEMLNMDASLGVDFRENDLFLHNIQTGHVRVYEVWQLERRTIYWANDMHFGSYYRTTLTPDQLAKFNEERLRRGMDPVVLLKQQYQPTWVCYHVLLNGWILREMISPFAHQEHPYTIGFARFVKGKWDGLVKRLIDTDRFRARIFATIDFLMGIGAKGVLLVPEDAKPEDWTWEQFKGQWETFGGMVVYKADPRNPVPQQITANSIPVGAFQLLAVLNQEHQDNSGISNALQGQAPSSGTPNALYQAQIQQSATNNLDLFNRFFALTRQRDRKYLQLVVQVHNKPMYLHIPSQQRVIQTDPARIVAMHKEVSTAEVEQTHSARMAMEQILLQFLGTFITFEQWLDVTGLPIGDKLKQMLQRTQVAPGAGLPDALQQLNPQSNVDPASLAASVQQQSPDSLQGVIQQLQQLGIAA